MSFRSATVPVETLEIRDERECLQEGFLQKATQRVRRTLMQHTYLVNNYSSYFKIVWPVVMMGASFI
jgi:hypothetical protein